MAIAELVRTYAVTMTQVDGVRSETITLASRRVGCGMHLGQSFERGMPRDKDCRRRRRPRGPVTARRRIAQRARQRDWMEPHGVWKCQRAAHGHLPASRPARVSARYSTPAQRRIVPEKVLWVPGLTLMGCPATCLRGRGMGPGPIQDMWITSSDTRPIMDADDRARHRRHPFPRGHVGQEPRQSLQPKPPCVGRRHASGPATWSTDDEGFPGCSTDLGSRRFRLRTGGTRGRSCSR